MESVDEEERITKHLRFFLSMAAATVSFVDFEREYQISDTTIRKAFMERVNALPKPYELETPKVLGIDEICLMKDDYQRKQRRLLLPMVMKAPLWKSCVTVVSPLLSTSCNP